MFNDQESHYYLRWLVKIADERPLRYEEIPQKFIKHFSLPGISQAINIRVDNKPEIDYDKVENFLIGKTFPDFNQVAAAIQENFQSDYDKLYACFYYVANNVKYDIQRSQLEKRNPLTLQTIFETRQGVCADYSKYFRELAKLCGIPSKKILILPYNNSSKGAGWDSYNPPNEPNYDHEANFIKINDLFFISEPTWASGSTNENNEFIFQYDRSYFLIPYYKGISDHFPQKKLDDSLNDHFTWEQFTAINKPNIKKDLCFESSPFQKITVENGFYEMQFSFIQPVESIFGHVYILEDQKWQKQENYKNYDNLISYECLEKNMPSLNFSHSKELRCRYKMTIKFPKEGEYKVETFLEKPLLFTSYFTVKRPSSKLNFISGCNKEKYGFIPITPREGLTKITNGFARIRFTVKLSRSDLLIYLFEINKDTLDHITEIEGGKWYNYFTTNLPFNYDSESKDLNDYLVEDWVLLTFPKEGLYEVKIYFANKENKNFLYGVTYYFDVTGVQKDNVIHPLYDLPNNRTFAPFTIDSTDEIRVIPSEKTIILEKNSDFYFHIFSEKECNVRFERIDTGDTLYPELMPGEVTDDKNITDRKYSAPYLDPGSYNLTIISNDYSTYAIQNYFVLSSKLPKESPAEKKMMKDLKDRLEGKLSYLNDIPLNIREDVEKMVAKSISDFKPSNDNLPVVGNESSELESEEEKAKLKMKIIELNKIVSDLGKQKEDQEKYTSKLEQEKSEISKIVTELRKQKEDQEKYSSKLEQERNEISNKLNELMKQIDNLNRKSNENGKEESEMIIKLKELEQRKQELEKTASNLEQKNSDLNNKFNEIALQKEKQEKRAKILEQEKNELNNKVSELEKQKEEIIKNMTEEKSITESKVHSFENEIHELEEKVQKHENYVLSLEKEKNEISSKLNDNESNKSEMTAKLKELENQTSILEKEKNSMNNKINELLKQKEEEQNHAHSLELKNNEINQQLEKLLKQREDMDSSQEQENKEMAKELKKLESRKQELENQANILKQEKCDLNSKFNELSLQKEEQEKRAKKLEQEKNELNNKVSELEKQKEEIIKNTAKEKSIADSKALSYENRINELMKQKEEQENRVKNLEQEKKKLSKKVNELKKQKGEVISKEGTDKTSDDIKNINVGLNSEELKSSNSKSGPDSESQITERKSSKPDIDLNPTERKSNEKERKSNQTEIELNPTERKSSQAETELNPIERKSSQKREKIKPSRN